MQSTIRLSVSLRRRRGRSRKCPICLPACTRAWLLGTGIGRCPRSTLVFHHHLRVDLFKLRCLDFLRPKKRHETSGRAIPSDMNITNPKTMTHLQRCLRHLCLSSPAASFWLRTCSIRRPMRDRESFKIATLSSRGMSSPDNLSCFCVEHQRVG